jgi:DNA-binding CsgD family transcriptional regulator
MAALGELDFSAPTQGGVPGVAMSDVEGFLHRNGLKYFSFAVIRRGLDKAVNPTIELKTNYKDAWADRYRERRYDQLDPLVQLSRSETTPIIWGSDSFLRRLGKRQYHFFMEAREFEVRCGASFPMRAVDGTVGLVTYTSDEEDVLLDVLNERGPQLLVAAHQIADGYTATEAVPEPEGNPLSPREREALIWVAEGCTSEEVAERMFITTSAVNYHLGNATRKLRARNRHHAALTALKLRYI